jgi:hypothetical protein
MDVITEYVNFSYNYLNSVMDRINVFAINSSLPDSFRWAGTNVSENRIDIAIYPYNYFEKSRFINEFVSSDAIFFIEEAGTFNTWEFPTTAWFEEPVEAIDVEGLYYSIQPLSNVIRPGMSVVGSFSIGYRARYNRDGSLGFVTTAHAGFTHQGQVVPGWGTVAAWRLSGSVDAAFVATGAVSGMTLSNQIELTNENLSTSVVQVFREGDILSKVGGRTGLTSGQVRNTNVSFNGLVNQVGTNIWGARGDSGGIVFTLSVNTTAGIVQGGLGEFGNSLHFVRASAINSELGLSRF